MRVEVDFRQDVQFLVSARAHTLISDQPTQDGGGDEGMTPPELLLAALGSCAAYYAVQYLRSRNLQLEGLHIDVDAEKAANPARLGHFRLRIRHNNLLSPEQEVALHRSVQKCLVHNTLAIPSEITLEIQGGCDVAKISTS